MKMLSRFRKGKKSDGADSQAVADPDEEGLLMPTAPAQPSADRGGDSQADVDAMPAAAESGGGGEGEAPAAPAEEDDDLLAAAESGGDGGEGEASAAPAEEDDDLLAAAEAPTAADEVKPEEAAKDDAAEDDLLSAFKVEEVHSDLADLTKDIEEVAMTDLLDQLRDVRGMLPATPAEDEDAA